MCFSMALTLFSFVACDSDDENSDIYVVDSGTVTDAVLTTPSNIYLLPKNFEYSYEAQDGSGNWAKHSVKLELVLHVQDYNMSLTRNNYYDQPEATLMLDSIGPVKSLSDIDATKIVELSRKSYSKTSATGSCPLIEGCGYIVKYEARRKTKYSPYVVSADENEYQTYTIYARIFVKEKLSANSYSIQYQAPWRP